MSTVTAARVVPADPASTALLLAGPAALEFWPGLHRLDESTSPVRVSAQLAGASERQLTIWTDPPRRTATSYVTSFSVESEGLPPGHGVLRITRQSVASADLRIFGTAEPGTAVSFELRTDGDYTDGVEEEITAAAARFLDNMAAFAAARATAD